MNPAHHRRGITKPPETERCPFVPQSLCQAKAGSYESRGMDRIDRILPIALYPIPAQSAMTAGSRGQKIATWRRPGPGAPADAGGLWPAGERGPPGYGVAHTRFQTRKNISTAAQPVSIAMR